MVFALVEAVPTRKELDMQFSFFALAGAFGLFLISSQPLASENIPAPGSASSAAKIKNLSDRYLLWPILLRLPGSLFLPPPELQKEPEPADVLDAEKDEIPGAVLEGTVFSEAGEPLAGVLVELVAEAGLEARLAARSASSDESGAYRLAGLPPGRHLLRASRGGFLAAEESFDMGDGGVRQADWTLSAALTVAGLIADSRGRPVVGARVLAFSGSAEAVGQPARSGLDGRFVLTGVAPGRVRLRGEPLQGAEVERTLILAPGEDAAEIELVVPASAQIAGRLLGVSPEDLAKAAVWATGSSGEHRAGYVDAEGAYSIEFLGPGEWRVAARAPGFPREANGSALLGEGGAARLDLELDAGGYRLAGRAVRAGVPLPGARIVLSSAGVFAGGATTGPGGEFAIDSLPAGSYQLLLVGAGQASTRDLELGSDLQIELDPGPAAPGPAEVR
jgi:hypothetical protein